jgi:hypothetical protein
MNGYYLKIINTTNVVLSLMVLPLLLILAYPFYLGFFLREEWKAYVKSS